MTLSSLDATADGNEITVTFFVTSNALSDFALFEGQVVLTPEKKDSPILTQTGTFQRFLDIGQTDTVQLTFTMNNMPSSPEGVYITANLTGPYKDSMQELVMVGGSTGGGGGTGALPVTGRQAAAIVGGAGALWAISRSQNGGVL